MAAEHPDDLHQRRRAGTVLSDQADELACSDVQARILQGQTRPSAPRGHRPYAWSPLIQASLAAPATAPTPHALGVSDRGVWLIADGLIDRLGAWPRRSAPGHRLAGQPGEAGRP